MLFCRLGGLSPVKHKLRGKILPSFHFPPPAKKGIYAFVWPYIEMFLVMWREQNKKELETNGFRKFDYEGPLWCHHEPDRMVVSKTSWFLTDTNELKILMKKELRKSREVVMKEYSLFVRDPYKSGSCEGFNITTDHLEVFIEKKHLGKVR